MKNASPVSIAFFAFCILLSCSAWTLAGRVATIGGAVTYAENSNPVEQVNPADKDQTVPMVQPRGLNPERDKTYSEVNKNNADAYKTQQDGYSNRVVAEGEADKLHAQACDIRNDCNSKTTISDVIVNFLAAAFLVFLASFGMFFTFRRR